MSIEARQIQETLYSYAAILNFTPSPQGLRAKFAHAPYKMPSCYYIYDLDSASVVMVEAGSTSHFRMAAMLNGPT